MSEGFAMVLRSADCPSAEEAWDDFDDVVAYFHEVVRGYKYWRRMPELKKDGEFYFIKGRIFAVEERLGGQQQAIDWRRVR